jgi:hypothetical protein
MDFRPVIYNRRLGTHTAKGSAIYITKEKKEGSSHISNM